MAKINEYIPIHYVGRRIPVRLNTGSDTLVEQSHQETTNINKIIARYRTSGQLPAGREGRYEDVSEIGDFTDVREQMNAAIAAYEDLPNSITDQFNDVGEFIEYAERQRQAAAIQEASDSGSGMPGESVQSGNADNSANQGGVQPPKPNATGAVTEPPPDGKKSE